MIGNPKGKTHERKSRTDAPQSSQKGAHFRSVGCVCGFLAVTALIKWTKAARLDDTQMILASVGAIYVLMGLIVGLGPLIPTASARVLNVEDSEKLIEQRPDGEAY